MLKCTQPEISVKLHAYELDMLSNDDREEFEKHILECSHCFSVIEKHEAVFDILKRDEAIKQEIIAGAKNAASLRPATGKFRSVTLATLAVAAIFLIVFLLDQEPDIVTMKSQTISFNRLRSADNAVVDLSQADQAIFEIPLEAFEKIDSVLIVLTKADGTELNRERLAVYLNAEYVSYVLPLEKIEPGLYLLVLSAIGEDNSSLADSYTFRVK